MVFSSFLFVFFFLPLIICLYYLAKNEYRNYILLAASILFYAYGEPKFVFVMLGSILINYMLALWIDKKRKADASNAARIFLALAVVINLGILFIFKYLDFSIGLVNLVWRTSVPLAGIVLPAGISFFTFQAMSYVIDVYRGVVPVQKNLFYLALYIAFFPQLIAGPIVRYVTFEHQIRNRRCTVSGFGEGGRRFLLGFCKKVILANNLSVAASDIFAMAEASVNTVNPILLWLGSLCYSLQILYDFSGYSDMAIGLGRMFGFRFEENFDYPYISKSATEFWRRWHISLGQWFRDYVYIPLGGSRVSTGRHLLNLSAVWLLTGIWHGARFAFIAWGLGWLILLVLEKYMIKPEKRTNKMARMLWQAVTLLCINFGWVIFNSNGLRPGMRFCAAMLGRYGVPFSADEQVIYYLREFGFFIAAGIVCATPALKNLGVLAKQKKWSAWVYAAAVPACYGMCFLWAVSYLILGAHNPFIYFNF